MISSVLYGICFLTIMTERGWRIKTISFICLSHLIIENLLKVYFETNINYFDFSLYLNITSALDIMLLVLVSLILNEFSKKLLMFLGSLALTINLIFGHYIFHPFVTQILLDYYYYFFIEVFVLITRLRDDTIKNWLRTCIILCCLLILHLKV